jgi:hypothetical protein
MAKDTSITVQMDARAHAAAPHSFVASGRCHRVVGLIRQWDRGRQRYFEVQVGDGHTAILRLDQGAGQWYLVDMRGRARPA